MQLIKCTFILIAISMFFSCGTQREAIAEKEEERTSTWEKWEAKAFLESCKRDAQEIEGLDPEHYCNCFLEKLRYDYTIDQVLNLSEAVIFEIAEVCIEGQD